MEWIGYDVRLDALRTVKKLLQCKPGGGGKEEDLWVDVVELKLRNIRKGICREGSQGRT
jgi:hypothetical protein